MKRYTFIFLALLLAVFDTPAQTLNARAKHSDSRAPLSLFINGPGEVTRFQNGQMLQIGTEYSMTAVAHRGRRFLGWNLVKVFTITEYTTDEAGSVTATTSTVSLPVPSLITPRPTLKFQVEPPEVILDEPGVMVINLSYGYQANFSETP